MSANLFGTRVRALREARNLTQEQLSERLGFKDRQTLSAIETGERRLSADELLRAVEVLSVSLETFTDPFLLIGEGKFSWRQQDVPPARLTDYEREAGSWIAAWRELAARQDRVPPLDRRALRLDKTSRYEDAIAAGERFAVQYDLGEVPARRLVQVMQADFAILVLMVDAIEGVSGAACRLPELDAVLINRREVAGRRHFDLAHELFHVLTWDTMPPDHVEAAAETSRNRVEQLANKFASAVLMPAAVLARFSAWSGLSKGDLVSKMNETADALAVTASALKWRLVDLDRLTAAAARGIDDGLLRNNGHPGAPKQLQGLFSVSQGDSSPPTQDLPPLFSKPFLEVIGRALDEGQLSMRRAAGLLGHPIDDLPALFAAHDVPVEIGI
jgi:transcriptional regulator with XRE-family HTH domain